MKLLVNYLEEDNVHLIDILSAMLLPSHKPMRTSNEDEWFLPQARTHPLVSKRVRLH